MSNNNSNFRYALLGIAMLLLGSSSLAQEVLEEKRFIPYFKLGINGGTSVFFGDIREYRWWPSSGNPGEWNFAGGLTLGYQFTPVAEIRMQGLLGRLSGTRTEWNTYFQTEFLETNISTTLNLNNLFGRTRVDRFLNIYGIVGIGLVQYNTEVKELGSGHTVKKVGHGYGKGINGSTLQGILLYGLGLDFYVNDRWGLQLETANRVMDSDALDGVESGYPLDYYNYTSLGITYKFGYNYNRLAREEAKEMERIYAMYEQHTAAMEAAKVEDTPIPVIGSEDLVEEATAKKEDIAVPVAPKLEYRVQILAKFKGPLSVKIISTVYLIPMYEIREEIYNGHFIYTVGSFDNYEEARKKRDELRRLFDITDAFVVVFREGQRLDQLPESGK